MPSQYCCLSVILACACAFLFLHTANQKGLDGWSSDLEDTKDLLDFIQAVMEDVEINQMLYKCSITEEDDI